MRTAEEVFGEMPAEPGSGKLNWREYEHACIVKLIAWQNEILEAAARECEDIAGVEKWATDSDVSSDEARAWDKACECSARGIRQLRCEPPAFSYQK